MRGKVVVLDFWGSWCIWCIRGIPDMKKYYEKYKNKLEIIGMDCGDSDEKWKAAVKKYELPWKHVYVPKNSKVLDNYKIEGFPTKIVIAPDGTVLKKVVGESPEFYEYLDQYFISH
jgi:thiol-disulfide isomerase/thioredoxin